MKVVTVLFGLTWLALTTACSERAPSAATTSTPELTHTGQATGQASTAPTDETVSSDQVRVFQVEDIVPAERNMEPTITNEDSFPAHRAPEESEEITPVNVRSADPFGNR